MLQDEDAAGLRCSQFLHHPFDQPPQCRLIRGTTDVDDVGQKLQQHVGMQFGNGETATDDKYVATAVLANYAAAFRSREHLCRLHRLNTHLAGKVKWLSSWKNKTVAAFELNRLVNPFHC